MTFHPPRIGPISGVLTAPTTSITVITGGSTGYCSFPVLGPPEEVGSPSEGATCPSDQTQQFIGFPANAFGTTIVYLVELAGVQTTPSVTNTKQLQTTSPYNTGALTPGNGYFAALLIEGFGINNDLNTPPVAPNLGSVTLQFLADNTPDAAHNPEFAFGYRHIALPHGSYDTTLIYPYSIYGWAEASTIWVSNGQQPTIKQFAAASLFGGVPSVTFTNPPNAGNVIVAMVGTRNDYTSIVAPSGSWSDSGLQKWNSSNNPLARACLKMFWKTVCT